MAKPWNSPAAMLAAPIPIISWLASTSSPRAAAKLVDVAIVSVSETRTMPIAAAESGPMSLTDVHGNEGDGKPLRQRADRGVSSRSSSAVASGRAHDGDEHRRHLRVIRGNPGGRQRHGPDEQGGGVRLVEVREERSKLVDEAVGVGGEAEQLRQLADDDRDREPVHVADLHLVREQVGDEAELAESEADLDQADDQRHHARERDRGRRIVSPASGMIAAKISGETDESGRGRGSAKGP